MTAGREYAVVVLTGDHAGDEVTQEGVPWRGDLVEARRIQGDMHAQAQRFGHLDVTYGVEAIVPQDPCPCGHQWSEHDEGGCHYSDGCTTRFGRPT